MIFQGCTCLRSFAACQSKECTDISGGALVSSAPTEQKVHQFKGVHLSQVHRPRSAPTKYMNAVCFVGGWVKTHE